MSFEIQYKSPFSDTTSVEVLILKTDIKDKRDVASIAPVLEQHPNIHRWNVDTDDIDHVLRIESTAIGVDEIISKLQQVGYHGEELPD